MEGERKRWKEGNRRESDRGKRESDRGKRESERGRREPSTEARRLKVQRSESGQLTCLNYIGNSLGPEFRVDGRVCQPYAVTGMD